jgi:hypothetical protein
MKRIVIAMLFVLVGCSEEVVTQDWETFVAENNACEVAEDCVVVFPGCPLGCFDAVNKEAEEAANQKAEELIGLYEAGGRACAYGCLAHDAPTCEAGKCSVQASEEDFSAEE